MHHPLQGRSLGLLFTSLLLFTSPLPANPAEESLTWESRPIGVLPQLSLPFGELYDIAVDGDGGPLIGYVDADTGAITVVGWANNQRQDTEIAATPFGFQDLEIATWQDRAFLAYQYKATSSSWPVYFSERIEGSWTTPTLVANPRNFMDLDLEVSATGEPLIAGIVQPFPGDTQVVLFSRTGTTWTPDIVRDDTIYAVSKVAFVVTTDGTRHVTYREYSTLSGNSTSRIMHARSDGGAWLTVEAFDGLLDDLVGTQSALPHLIGVHDGTTSVCHWSFDGTEWGAGTPVGQASDPARFGDIASDGTLHVASLSRLFSRVGGAWSSRPSHPSRRIVVDSSGAPHLLGEQSRLLSYHRLVPDLWCSSQVTDPHAGAMQLNGALATVEKKPRLYGSSPSPFSVVELAESSAGSWAATAIPEALYGAPFARGSDRNLHQLNGPASYSFGNVDGMSRTFIPFSNTSGSSSDRHAMVVDADGNPHVCAIVSQGNTKTVQYAVKRCGQWAIETVDSIGFTRHTDLALDSRGAPHIVTSDGIYRRTTGGWVKDHPLDRVYHPNIVIDADDVIHTVYGRQGAWSTHGSNGSYTTRMINGWTDNSAVRSLSLLQGRPVLALPTEETGGDSLRFGQWIDDQWIFETASPIAADQEIRAIDMTSFGDSSLLLAAERSTVISFLITPWINTHVRSFPAPPSSDLSLSVSALEPATVPPGEYPSGTIYVQLTNRGAQAATNVEVSTIETLPANLIVTGVTASRGSFADDTWSLDLPAGESATLALSFRADSFQAPVPLDPVFGMRVTACQPADPDFSDHYGFTRCSIVGTPDVTIGIIEPLALDPASGFWKGRIRLTNNESTPLPAFRLVPTGLPVGTILWNANHPDGILFGEALSAGEQVELDVCYYRSRGDSEIQPVYTLDFSPPAPVGSSPPALAILDARRLPSGATSIEFASLPEAIYAIEFSNDGQQWTRLDTPLTASSSSTEWTDPGDGSVPALPAGGAERYYRIRLMWEP